MVPAMYATTVNPIQNNAKMENGIMAFTVTSLSLSSCAACGVLATAGTACDATPHAARLSGLASGLLSLAVRPAGLALGLQGQRRAAGASRAARMRSTV